MTQGVVEAKYTLGVFVPATVCRDAGGEVVDVIRGHHTPESLRAVIAAERRAMDESHAYLSAADAAVERERVEYEAGGRRAKDARARAERRAARTAVEHYRANEAKYRANGHDYEALLAAAMQAAGMA